MLVVQKEEKTVDLMESLWAERMVALMVAL